MADLTSLYKNRPNRDFSIQACADCINKIALQFTNEFKAGFFTDYFDIAGGTQPPKSAFINEPKEGYIKFLQIRDFSSVSTPTYIPILKNNKICSEKDLVLGRYGASVGKILTGKAGAYNVACAKIIFLEEDTIDREFLFYWLHSSYFQNFLTSISRSAQGGFNKNDLSRIKTYFPSIEIQKKLTSILRYIDLALLNNDKIIFNKIGKTEVEIAFIELVEKFLSFINEGEELSTELTHQLSLVKKLRQQLLQDAVQGKLVAQNPKDEPASELLKKIKAEKEKLIIDGKLAKDRIVSHINEDIPYELPPNWIWCRLSDIAEAIDPNPSHRMPNYVNEGIPFISTENFKSDDTLDFNVGKKVTAQTLNEHIARYEIHDDSFAFSRIGSIGKTIKLPMDRTYCVSHALSVINPISKRISLKYLRFVMSTEFILKQAKSDVKSISVPDLGMAKIRNFFIPLPPFNEQNRIVQKVDELMLYCNELEASIKQSEAQNEKLLQQVLREALRKEPVGV